MFYHGRNDSKHCHCSNLESITSASATKIHRQMGRMNDSCFIEEEMKRTRETVWNTKPPKNPFALSISSLSTPMLLYIILVFRYEWNHVHKNYPWYTQAYSMQWCSLMWPIENVARCFCVTCVLYVHIYGGVSRHDLPSFGPAHGAQRVHQCGWQWLTVAKNHYTM